MDTAIRPRSPAVTYARLAGVLLLVSMVAGALGEMYIPSKIIVAGNAAATAGNITGSNALFRLGFATYLIEAICDIALSLLFYELLKVVRRDLALLAAFFGLVSTAVFGFAEFFYFAAGLVLRNADWLASFTADQRNTLAFLSLKAYGAGSGIFMALYGIATAIRGYLVYRSAFLPKFLGVLMVLAGAGFIAKNFLLVLAPAYASDLLLLPVFVSTLALTAWLLGRGVDVAKWDAGAEPPPYNEHP